MAILRDQLTNLQQKARERTVKTQNIEYDLETLVKKVKRGVIKLDPEYQRRHRWNDQTSSRLIESLILNIPIPLIYLSQDVDVDAETHGEEARYSVIDGQQRLNAIFRFFEDRYALVKLDALEELEGLFYKDLPPFLIRRLEERTIKCLRVDSTLDEQVKYDIFERLNSGAVKLEAQELRNAVSRGPFNDLIKHLATNVDFRKLIRVNPTAPEVNSKVKKMEDVELVLRFFALISGNYLSLRRGFKKFLDDEMDRMNKLNDQDLLRLESKFLITMHTIYEYFGDTAFAKYRFPDPDILDVEEVDHEDEYRDIDEQEDADPQRMSPFNVAVYDALTVSVSTFIDDHGTELPAGSTELFRDLFKDKKFFEATSGSINDRAKIITRIDAARKIFQK